MKFFSFFCIAVVFVLISCKTRQVAPKNYLDNIADTTIPGAITVPEPLIQKNDLLSIKVYSASIDPSVDLPYNLPEQGIGGSGTAAGGFLVDANGNIEYPRLGTLHAEGLTKIQLADLIKSKLESERQLTRPSVIIRFTNYKVTILGEVNTPGSFTVPTERITILEALGLAGDVTEFGKKNNVKIYRENNGSRSVATIDLTSKELFTSPYYLLRQNDVVIVDQTGQRSRQRDQQNVAQQVGLATSILTTIALILNFIK